MGNSLGPMLNAYPDSLGGKLADIARFLALPELKGVFSSFYSLPSIFHADLDRGFSIIDYGLNRDLANEADLAALEKLGVDLKLDIVLNHASVLSAPFQDILKNGDGSPYRDFFIDWNKFWEGYGVMTEGGYIQPDEKYLSKMFFRKPGLPILMVRFPDGRRVPYWNTFYQEVRYPKPDAQDLMKAAGLQYGAAARLAAMVNAALDGGKAPEEIDFGEFAPRRAAVLEWLDAGRKYLGQMDLNIRSPLVWKYYDDTLRTLSEYGAKIVRLDAFAYAPKEPGEKNFLNDPGTWELLERVNGIAERYGLTLLPEIHASYAEGIYDLVASKGYMVYDFFLPGLLIDALERGDGSLLAKWAEELIRKNIRAVNMLGCHDGIPMLDLQGLLPDEQIQQLIDLMVARGGFVKNLHGQKNVYYQVNATYYSALGEDDGKMLMARAIQLFMPGKPQVWYLDLFGGKNDIEAMRRAGAGGHKEINRTNLSWQQIEAGLRKELTQKQLELLRLRSEHPAFRDGAEITAACNGPELTLCWKNGSHTAKLTANLETMRFQIETSG